MPDSDLTQFYTHLRASLATASNEAEVRDRFCNEIHEHYQITFRLERGRSDARSNHMIFEFKDKGLFRGKIDSIKFQEAYHQLADKYIPQQAAHDGRKMQDYMGVAIDGESHAYVFYEDNGKHRHTALIPLTTVDGFYPLLDAVVQDVRRPFTAEALLEDFGAETPIAKAILQELWSHLDKSLADGSRRQKVYMLYEEWRKLFAQTTNFGRIGQERIDDFLLAIGLQRPLDYTKALFVLHTYSALLLKLIAAEVVTTLRYTDYSGFAASAAGSSLENLRGLLSDRIENSQIFVDHHIENFIEGTFFSWYIDQAPHSLLKTIRDMLARLGLYTFPTETHQRVRDVVKVVYQSLVPEALRKNIGEFYTPDWLVDFTLDEVGYSGPSILTRRLLDPCSGSGNFVIQAIGRFKQAAREAGQTSQLAKDILRHIMGFDLNPLAVLAARLNYLLAIADVLPGKEERIEIPIYLADAVYAPTIDEPATGDPTRSYKISTLLEPISLALPELLVQNQEALGTVLSIMERDIENRHPSDEFLSHLRRNLIVGALLWQHPDWTTPLNTLYMQVEVLESKKWDRIWCRIIRNYFASVAIGKVDVIASNPPWVRWSELPDNYRERIKPTCQQYAIFSQTPFFGGNELDISGMIAYTVSDKWLADGGTLGFIIPRTHFQAPSSEVFRSFRLPNGTPLGVQVVHDLTDVRPFPQLANKPSVLVWKRGIETCYPVRYLSWSRVPQARMSEDSSLAEVKAVIVATEMQANPIPPDQRWSLLPTDQAHLLDKLKGGSLTWVGRKGITTDLNGAYFVDLLGPGAEPGTVEIRNRPGQGRRAVPLTTHDIESDLVYPLLKGGSQIRAFAYSPGEAVVIVPNRAIHPIQSLESFRRDYRVAYQYFSRLNRLQDRHAVPLLESRSTWRQRMSEMGAPFYAIYNVGPYTFAPYKVVWAEMSSKFCAAVVSSQMLPYGVGLKPIVPDHKVYFVGVDNEEAAHFLCALMNSALVRTFIDSFTVKLQVGTLFRQLNLPAYDATSKIHKSLSALSKQAHITGVSAEIQAQIDLGAWTLIGN